MSLRLRLTLWYSGILAVTLLLFGIGLYFFLNYYIYDQQEKSLKQTSERTYARIESRLGLTLKGLPVFDLELESQDLRSTSIFLQLYNTQSQNLSRSMLLEWLGVQLPLSQSTLNQLTQTSAFYSKEKIGDLELLVYNVGIPGNVNGEKKLIGVLQVAYSINEYEKFFKILQYILTFLALLTILLAASLGWFLARKALMPIDQVIHAANQIERGVDLDKRIVYDGPKDEIGRLTDTINGMLGRIQVGYSELEEAYRTQRRFVSDASHELRTPLTTIRGNVELLEKMWKQAGGDKQIVGSEQIELSLEAMHDISGEAQRMSRLVNDLLALARADAGVEMAMAPVEMKTLVEEVGRRAQFLSKAAEWQLGDLSPLEGVVVHGNRDYLQQLLFIFIENAFKYTFSGSVKLDALRSDTQIGIRIADTGIGMDKEEVPHIFERFYRADESRGQTAGTGLGLSIAKWIIDEHKGSIEVTTSKEVGSIFVVWLPASFPLSLH
jgi:two-component system OmpR family sensor kinase